jgi:hypothetical protein
MEIRNIEFRNQSVEDRTISGMAIMFNVVSNVLWDSEKKRSFREVILPTAVSQELLDNSDIFFVINHKRDQMVARRKNGVGSLSVELREDGVAFSFKAPNTQLGNDLLEMIARGEIFDCSFAFNDIDAKWSFDEDIPLRTVTHITGLYDMSAVYNGAYPQTEITARSIEEAEEAQKPVETQQVEETIREDESSNSETEINRSEDTTINASYIDDLQHYKEILQTL